MERNGIIIIKHSNIYIAPAHALLCPNIISVNKYQNPHIIIFIYPLFYLQHYYHEKEDALEMQSRAKGRVEYRGYINKQEIYNSNLLPRENAKSFTLRFFWQFRKYIWLKHTIVHPNKSV